MTIKPRFTRLILLFVLPGIICASSLPYIKAAYDYSQCNGREIAQAIISKYEPNEKVLVLNNLGYKTVLDYYLLRFSKPGHPVPVTIAFTDISQLEGLTGNTTDFYFVVVPRDATKDVRLLIRNLGYNRFAPVAGGDFLFVRSP